MYNRVNFIQFGKFKSKLYERLFEEYTNRIKNYAKLELKEFKLTKDEPGFFKRLEEKVLLSLKNTTVISLSEHGELFDSIKFSNFIDDGSGTLSVVIGSSWGLPDYVEKISTKVLSMGRMTLPHEAVRMLTAEQLYRAFTIIKKENYHK